ncbi:phosphatase PAP2 family protein [Dactylosporangium sp. CA-139066]|uniref:phosphatase PAP2 family protein n=1 Tax=Dactylosporangium sp. CA-139066 TaxID=3239930 RepID=UPI003D8C67C0
MTAGSVTRARVGVAVEVVGLLLWFLLFSFLQAAAGKDVVAATANALALQDAERAVHLDIELRANHWLAGHLVLSHLAVYIYRLYYAAILGVLVWVAVRHAEVYRKVRRTMVAMMALVLAVYWTVPMSPPRFALPGTVDIVALYDTLLPWLFPALMVAVVFGTANHYVLDVVGSVVLLLAGIACAAAWGRFAERRPVMTGRASSS